MLPGMVSDGPHHAGHLCGVSGGLQNTDFWFRLEMLAARPWGKKIGVGIGRDSDKGGGQQTAGFQRSCLMQFWLLGLFASILFEEKKTPA